MIEEKRYREIQKKIRVTPEENEFMICQIKLE